MAGSPKNLSPPWSSKLRRLRWMAPTVAVVMVPYDVVYWARLLPTSSSILRRSFRSSSASCWSSAMRNAIDSTSLCVSFKSRMRLSRMGPISLTVVRSGCPCSPKTSQKHTGHSLYSKPQACRLLSAILFSKCTLPPPALPTPDRSPLMSVAKTGTPMALKVSARFCSVQVFPVPVAPAIRPWRLAMEGMMPRCLPSAMALKGIPVLSIIRKEFLI